MAVTATLVRELRDKTGAAMMDCKKALEATNGDLEAAVDHLRKAGLKTAEKKSQRSTGDGRVFSLIDGKRGAVVSVACETDFVAKTPDFTSFLEALAKTVLDSDPSDTAALMAQPLAGSDETVESALKQLIGKLGENILVDAFKRVEGGTVGTYVHHNDKVGVLAAVDGDVSEDTMKDLCLHIAFHKPPYLGREEVQEADIERERAVLRDSDELKSKPAEIQDKIIEGKMKNFFKEKVLVEQPWVKDDKQTVQKALGGAKISAYACLEIGS